MYRRTVAASVILAGAFLSGVVLAGHRASAGIPAPTPAPSPAPAPGTVKVAAVNGAFVNITRVHVNSAQRNGEWYADVTSAITLNGVPNQSFTYEAALVDREGKLHTSKRGGEYASSREVSTGDEEDTDRYTVSISLKGLFSSRPPDLFVRTRLLDVSGKVVANGPLQRFSPPGD